MHYSTFLFMNMLRTLLGKPRITSLAISQEDYDTLRVTKAHTLSTGHRAVLQFKDKFYQIDITVIEPKVLHYSDFVASSKSWPKMNEENKPDRRG